MIGRCILVVILSLTIMSSVRADSSWVNWDDISLLGQKAGPGAHVKIEEKRDEVNQDIEEKRKELHESIGEGHPLAHLRVDIVSNNAHAQNDAISAKAHTGVRVARKTTAHKATEKKRHEVHASINETSKAKHEEIGEGHVLAHLAVNAKTAAAHRKADRVAKKQHTIIGR